MGTDCQGLACLAPERGLRDNAARFLAREGLLVFALRGPGAGGAAEAVSYPHLSCGSSFLIWWGRIGSAGAHVACQVRPRPSSSFLAACAKGLLDIMGHCARETYTISPSCWNTSL